MVTTTAKVIPTTVQGSEIVRELGATLPLVIILKAFSEIFSGRASLPPSALATQGR